MKKKVKVKVANPEAKMSDSVMVVKPEGDNKHSLSEVQSKELRDLEQIVAQSKYRIADLYEAQAELTTSLTDELANLKKVKENFFEKVKTYASDHGIDVDDPAKGKWNLNTDTMTFTKVD